MQKFDVKNVKLALAGLGYVGLPLAVEFSKKMPVIGYDVNKKRIIELKKSMDLTGEVDSQELSGLQNCEFTIDTEVLCKANVVIVTVPTPIDKNKIPNLDHLKDISEVIGSHLSVGDLVIYESTVYPGVTEEICVPILQKTSGLKFNEDFFVGYSPERINPGDKDHKIKDIKKVTSGSTPACADFVDELYSQIITAGTHKAPSIRVAEAAKVIENVQRDVNIALINELSLLFERLEIDTDEVLAAANTKWNFLDFKPGLVGGHCIGVDPYYLTHKAKEVGYHPDLILAGRKINDSMGKFVAQSVIKSLLKIAWPDRTKRILILGLSFKENCPDIRNTKVIDIIDELQAFGMTVDVFDPVASREDAKSKYGISLIEKLGNQKYQAVILAVPHKTFLSSAGFSIRDYCCDDGIIFDVKSALPKIQSDLRL
jgi:UDP-N-acetyl-D-glucosamine/UDP-N-acetyl-D-galactosamine dehydrogenase